jgi:hypothetical protein
MIVFIFMKSKEFTEESIADESNKFEYVYLILSFSEQIKINLNHYFFVFLKFVYTCLNE